MFEITPQILLKAYCCGIFPMADSADDPTIFWVEPDIRGILPLDNFHVPRSLRKAIRRNKFHIRINNAFDQVVEKCAEETADRELADVANRLPVKPLVRHKPTFVRSPEAPSPPH